MRRSIVNSENNGNDSLRYLQQCSILSVRFMDGFYDYFMYIYGT